MQRRRKRRITYRRSYRTMPRRYRHAAKTAAGSKTRINTKLQARRVPRSDAVPAVSVIIPAMNEQKTIASVVRKALRVHPSCEVIVVANGCRDRTAEAAESAGARVLRYEQPLGHDVGRSLGTQAARGQVMLYLDGDMPIEALQLRPFALAVLGGVDVALNRYNGPVRLRQAHPVVQAKHALNTLLRRADLQGASLTAVPHALSRRSVDLLGTECLSVPPLALAKAVAAGLRVEAVHEVPVGRLNRRRAKVDGIDPLQQVVLMDHIQAVNWYLSETDPRGGRSDLGRDRKRVRR